MYDQAYILSLLRSHIDNCEDNIDYHDFDLWRELLRKGRDLHASLNTLAKAWWQDMEIVAYERNLEYSGGGLRPYYWPWLLYSQPHLDAKWLERAEKQIANTTEEKELVHAVLGTIKSGDLGLAEIVDHYLHDADRRSREEFLDQLYQKRLTPLPHKGDRSWQQRNRLWPPLTNVARQTFFEGLEGLCYTARPVRFFSRSQLGFPSGPEKPKPPRVKLLAVNPDDAFDPYVQKDDDHRLVFSVNHHTTPPELEAILQWFDNPDEFIADIYVLPEFAVSEEDRQRLQAKCHQAQENRFLMIAGSGHVEMAGSENSIANRAALVYPTGKIDIPDVFHLKSEPFRLGNNLFRHLHYDDDGLKSEVKKESEIPEGLAIQGASKEYPLICAETPWGRLSFLICKDILDPMNNPLLESLQDVGVDHLFVPSFWMGNRDAFQDSATALRLHRVATYIVDGKFPEEVNTINATNRKEIAEVIEEFRTPYYRRFRGIGCDINQLEAS